MRTGRGRQAVAEHVGEVPPALFDQRTVLHPPRAPATTGRPLPGILEEFSTTIFGLQGSADSVLQIQQVGFDGLSTVTHGGTLKTGKARRPVAAGKNGRPA